MSSLFDVPAHILLLLSLAASGGSEEPHHAQFERTEPAMVSQQAHIDFTEQVWLEALKSGAGGGDLASEASSIFKTSSGRYYVPADAQRARIVKLRLDDEIAAMVTLGFARRNSVVLKSALGRAMTPGDLYVAHLFGTDTAIALLKTAEAAPNASLAGKFPALVRMNPELRLISGRPASVRATVDRLKRPLERLPSGAAVAQWFEHGQPMLLGGWKGTVGQGELHPEARAEQRSGRSDVALLDGENFGWTTTVVAAP